MRLSLKRLQRYSISLRPYTTGQALQTCPSRHGMPMRRPNVAGPLKSRPTSNRVVARSLAKNARNARQPTPASLADAVREEEMDMRYTGNDSQDATTPNVDGDYILDDLVKPQPYDRKNPDAWMLLLDRFLPQDLRISIPDARYTSLATQQACHLVLRISKSAQAESNAGIDLLTYMGIRHGRWKAVVYLIDMLLKRVAADVATRSARKIPSNIAWPSELSLDEACRKPIEVDQVVYKNQQTTSHWDQENLDPRYSDSMSQEKDATMTQIWYSLGSLIIESKEMPHDEAEEVMSVVYRIIGQIHNSDLVPDNVYSYVRPDQACTIQRPAIMHLLSSRMLSTLSDAVWRSHQDEVIAQAVKQGAQYKDLSYDPPGGRFRLKVRPLGSEVWLEFVLWCCVDGGFADAGARIILRLRQQSRNPWFAVNWAATGGTAIEWERVKHRHGGTVGQIEGYSSERPFVEMESRTISTEVVLSVIESLIISTNVGLINRGSATKRVMKWIRSVVSFLEPHGLPFEYFDYLAVRMAQSDGFDPERQPEQFLAWTETMAYFRSLETSTSQARPEQTLALESIFSQSELHAGMLHQNLDAFIAKGDVRHAIDVFSNIQQFIDNSKLHSIGAFLSGSALDDKNGSSINDAAQSLEYVQSHGHLPLYKVAGFLNLVTDSKLVRLGQWLLYNEDVDGAPIPIRAYGLPCLATPLVRFAALSNDELLVQRVFNFRRHETKLKPSVTFLRAVVNARMIFLDFEGAEEILRELSSAQAGGYSPSNLAHLLAVLLNLESHAMGLENHASLRHFNRASRLAERILSGWYDGNKGDFMVEQHAIFRRQIGCILRVCSNISDTSLCSIADSWRDAYDPGNDIGVATSTFNIILAAVVDTKGAKEGQRLWDLFCQDPRAKFDPGASYSVEDVIVPRRVEVEDEDWESMYLMRTRYERPETLERYIPMVDIREHELNVVASDVQDGNPQESVSPPPQAEGGISFRMPFESGFSKTGMSPHEKPKSPKTAGFIPLVIPDLRTLRLIVRGALAEQRAKRAHDLDVSEQQDTLKWATQFYEAFGNSKQLIEQEIQQVYLGNGMNPAEARVLYDASRRKQGLIDKSRIDVVKHFNKGREVTVSYRSVD